MNGGLQRLIGFHHAGAATGLPTLELTEGCYRQRWQQRNWGWEIRGCYQERVRATRHLVTAISRQRRTISCSEGRRGGTPRDVCGRGHSRVAPNRAIGFGVWIGGQAIVGACAVGSTALRCSRRFVWRRGVHDFECRTCRASVSGRSDAAGQHQYAGSRDCHARGGPSAYFQDAQARFHATRVRAPAPLVRLRDSRDAVGHDGRRR
jgi:hypothetical protein